MNDEQRLQENESGVVSLELFIVMLPLVTSALEPTATRVHRPRQVGVAFMHHKSTYATRWLMICLHMKIVLPALRPE